MHRLSDADGRRIRDVQRRRVRHQLSFESESLRLELRDLSFGCDDDGLQRRAVRGDVVSDRRAGVQRRLLDVSDRGDGVRVQWIAVRRDGVSVR